MTRELLGLTALFLGAFTLLSLVTYNPSDYAAPVKVILNKAGRAGANWAGSWVEFLGLGAYLVGVGFTWLGLRCFIPGLRLPVARKFGASCLALVLLTLLSSPWGIFGLSVGAIKGGGYCGQTIFNLLSGSLSSFGAYFLLAFALIAAVQLTFGLTWDNFWRPVTAVVQDAFWQSVDAWQEGRERRRQEKAARPKPEPRVKQPAAKVVTAPGADKPAQEPDAIVPSEPVRRFLDEVAPEKPEPEKSAAPTPRSKGKDKDKEASKPRDEQASPAKPVAGKTAPLVKPLGKAASDAPMLTRIRWTRRTSEQTEILGEALSKTSCLRPPALNAWQKDSSKVSKGRVSKLESSRMYSCVSTARKSLWDSMISRIFSTAPWSSSSSEP